MVEEAVFTKNHRGAQTPDAQEQQEGLEAPLARVTRSRGHGVTGSQGPLNLLLMVRLELFHHFPSPGGSFLTLFSGPSVRPVTLLREGRERAAGLQPVTQIHRFKVSDAVLPHPDALKCELLTGTARWFWGPSLPVEQAVVAMLRGRLRFSASSTSLFSPCC